MSPRCSYKEIRKVKIRLHAVYIHEVYLDTLFLLAALGLGIQEGPLQCESEHYQWCGKKE